MSDAPPRGYWNHNTHYHRVLLDAIPHTARFALDVGCGEGVLARQLRERVQHVTGIDLDAASVERAREHGGDVAYIQDDAMTHPFAPEAFDAVTSVATLHHLGTERGLTRLASLVRPGGLLGIIGLGQPQYPRDLPIALTGAVMTRVLSLRHGLWEHSAPVADPIETHHEVRAIARRLLPDCDFRQPLLWRHTIVWRKQVS